jgi:hypothetical protein
MDTRTNRTVATAEVASAVLQTTKFRPGVQRIATATAALMLLLAAMPAEGHDPIVGEFTCPLCLKRFTDVYLWHQPLCLNELEPWYEPGLYVRSYVGPGEYIFVCCPHCGYCNEVAGFHVVGTAEAEVRKNPYAPPPPAAKEEANAEGKDKANDGSERESDRRFYAKMFAAQPLDFPAIKAAMTREVDPSVFRYVNAYFPERLDILLRTVPGLSALERYHVALTGVAACDNAGETEGGLDFRTRAIEAGREMLAGGFPDDMSDDGRLALRYLTARMMLAVGRARHDEALRTEGRRIMNAVCQEGRTWYDQWIEERAADISRLRDGIRRRAVKIGLNASSMPSRPEDIESEDPGIVALVERIREGSSTMASLRRQKQELDDWVREGQKQLAADALADLLLEKALAAVQDASPVEREAFLMLHGWRWREPPVREFVRDLLLPISPVHGDDRDYRTLLQGNAFADVFGGHQEEVDEAEAVAARQFERYVLAIRQSYNPSNTTFTFRDLVTHVVPEMFECRLPKPPDMAASEGKAGYQSISPVAKGETVAVRMAPENADLIRRCLAGLSDAARPSADDLFAPPSGTRLFGPGPAPPSLQTLESLCRVDTPWLARLLFEDRKRRPNVYLWAYRYGGFWERTLLPSEWPRIRPARLIAKHLPDEAKQATRDALDRLASGKATPVEAAATLPPLAWIEDDESLRLLRRAADHRDALLSSVARNGLRECGEVPPLHHWLTQGGGKDRVPAKWPGAISALGPKDVPTLRKALPAARKAVEEARDSDEARAAYWADENVRWILAALGYLGDADALREYNAMAFRVHVQPGDSVTGYTIECEEKDHKGLTHTPLTAQCYDLLRILDRAWATHCTEVMADELVTNFHLLPQWQTENDVRLLKALAANPKTHGHYRKLAANLAPRPVTLSIKYELLEQAVEIPVPEVTEAIRRWMQSADPELAADAREVLQRLAP